MLGGIPLIDAHVHAARLPTLKLEWREWAQNFGKDVPLDGLYDGEGKIRPDRFDEYMAEEGVDIAILFCEYTAPSPPAYNPSRTCSRSSITTPSASS